MKVFAAIFCLLAFSLAISAQNETEVLATANSQNFTVQNLPELIREAYIKLPETIAEKRVEYLNFQIEDVLIKLEAESKGVNSEQLFASEVTAKIPDPTDDQIKKIYDANRTNIGDKTLEEMRSQIIRFLRQKPEQEAYKKFITDLKLRYNAKLGKDVNALNLKPSDLLVDVAGKPITVKDFADRNDSKLYDFEAGLYDTFLNELKEAVYYELITADAKAQKIDSSDLIAKEITNKMKDFTDVEREQLQSDFAKRLFQKYNAKFLLKEPLPFVNIINTEGEPFKGKSNAPVTVVMFTDFQCPACAAYDPILRKVIAGFGDKVRFVVRDFPLVSIHENAFNAAIAANAAFKQGKFFEYKEILYQNQKQLDKPSLIKYARQVGLDVEQFTSDLENEKFSDEVNADIADGKSHNVSGTPTIFVNGVKVRTLSADAFRIAIANALSK